MYEECERALREYEQQRVWITTAQQEAGQVLHQIVQVMLDLRCCCWSQLQDMLLHCT